VAINVVKLANDKITDIVKLNKYWKCLKFSMRMRSYKFIFFCCLSAICICSSVSLAKTELKTITDVTKTTESILIELSKILDSPKIKESTAEELSKIRKSLKITEETLKELLKTGNGNNGIAFCLFVGGVFFAILAFIIAIINIVSLSNFIKWVKTKT
jgi:hypothetical protein